MTQRIKRFDPDSYRIVVHKALVGGRVYLSAVNFDFSIQHQEEVTKFTEDERLLATARLIIGIQKKIADRLKSLDRQGALHPSPMNSEEILKPKIPDDLSIGEVARILGEKIHNVRRWADSGKIPSKVTPSGHRRFSRKDVLRYIETLNEPEDAPQLSN